MTERKDFSGTCDRDDENPNNPCWDCSNFVFPIGCMIDEKKEVK